METIQWDEKFSVNVAEMDRHHKELLGYLSELQHQLYPGNESQKVGVTLNALAEYARFHFAEEERLLQEQNSPCLSAQINQHAYFTKEVQEMFRQYNLGILPGQSVLSFLRDWFINHIMQEDHKYGTTLKPTLPPA